MIKFEQLLLIQSMLHDQVSLFGVLFFLAQFTSTKYQKKREIFVTSELNNNVPKVFSMETLRKKVNDRYNLPEYFLEHKLNAYRM